MVVVVENLRSWYKETIERRKNAISTVFFLVCAAVAYLGPKMFGSSKDIILYSIVIPTVLSLGDVLLSWNWKRLPALFAWIGAIIGGLVAWLTA